MTHPFITHNGGPCPVSSQLQFHIRWWNPETRTSGGSCLIIPWHNLLPTVPVWPSPATTQPTEV